MWVEAAAAVPYHYYFAFWMAKTATSCTKTNAYSRDAHSIAHIVENVAKITILQYFSSKSFRFNNRQSPWLFICPYSKCLPQNLSTPNNRHLRIFKNDPH